jgi:hypothetical protein
MTVAAERVGQDDVGTRIDELLVQRAHLLGVIGVPELGRITGTKATFEVVGARRPVGEQGATGRQQFGK